MVDGALLRLPGHSLTLGAKDEALWKKISADLARDRFKPPRVRDFAQAYAMPGTRTCASCCGSWPSSAVSSRWRRTSFSCGPWWPR